MSDITKVAEQRGEARDAYRHSLAAEVPLTGAQLGEMFGRSARWGRDRIAEAKDGSQAAPEPAAEIAAAAAAPVPVQRRGATAMAWCALGLGVVASIAANVGHTVYVVMPGSVSAAAVAGAAFWPVSLAIAVEVMARVSWPSGVGYAVARFAGVGAVAAVAAVISYRHMAGLLAYWGEDSLSAHLGPLGVDGLILVGGFALLAVGQDKARR